jgi:siroheme synthase (precorrin-2 oxidase/ferrochelatase)
VRRGSLTVSVSTAGKSPLLAVAVRDRLASLLPAELAGGLERLAEARRIVGQLFPFSQADRRRALGALVTREGIDHLMEGRLAEFEAHWERWKTALTE